MPKDLDSTKINNKHLTNKLFLKKKTKKKLTISENLNLSKICKAYLYFILKHNPELRRQYIYN